MLQIFKVILGMSGLALVFNGSGGVKERSIHAWGIFLELGGRKNVFEPLLLNDYSAKDEGLGACAQTRVRRRIFSLFPMMVGSQVMRSTTKNQFCFLSLIRCLVKFVVLESHSQSL